MSKKKNDTREVRVMTVRTIGNETLVVSMGKAKDTGDVLGLPYIMCDEFVCNGGDLSPWRWEESGRISIQVRNISWCGYERSIEVVNKE